jgi:hypothetical protein
MTELELYKYIKNNAIEWHRRDNNGTYDVIIMPNVPELLAFLKLVKDYYGAGIEAMIKNDYFAIWMKDLCFYFDIDMDNVFCEE